ncbi:hypothetical protein TcWFU_004248 [Taenia crassiceps]|uniref:Uncharacterized protein n=1 Tax=Taenia crassiceps TaxID=6207 RepID=A0ABR4QQV3_9CEST
MLRAIHDDKDILVDLLTRKLEDERSLRMQAEEHRECLEEKVAEYAKYITQLKHGILNRLELAECQTHTVIDSHSSRLTEAMETISRLTTQLEHTRKHFEAESQRMKEKLVSVQHEYKSSIKSITDELNKVKKERDSHQAELLDLRSKFKTSTQVAAEAKAAAERLREKEAQSAAEAAHSAELLAEAQQKASRHAARATNLATVVGQLRGQFAEVEKNREETQELLKKVTEKSFNTESLLISAKRRCQALTTRVDELEIENERLKGVIIDLEQDVSRLKKTASSARDDSANWQRECEKANTKVKELTAALISASVQHESTLETELQAEIRALREQTAEFAALQTETAEARAAEEADRLRVLRSCIEHELRPHLDSANERSDCLVKRVDAMGDQIDIQHAQKKISRVGLSRNGLVPHGHKFAKVLCRERDLLLLQLSEQQSMENEWESFLDGIESLVERLISSVRHEEKVMKYEMAIQKTANEKLVRELKVDKEQIDSLTAGRNALWRSLRERTNSVESWNRDMARLQEELAEARKNLHSATKEREAALTTLRQVEQCLDQQKVAFCDRIVELETQIKNRECELQELKCRSDKRLSDLEAEVARERMEKEALIATGVCVDRGGGCNHDEATAGTGVEELRTRLAERDAEVARLEVLSQERAQLVEQRATELADLHEAVAHRIADLQEQLRSALSKNEEQRSQLENALEENRETLNQLTQATMRIDGLQLEVDRLTEENRRLHEQLAASRAHFEKSLIAHQATGLVERGREREAVREEFERTLMHYKSSLAEMEDKVVKKDRHIQNMESKVAKLNAEILQLENRLHASESRRVAGQEKPAVEDRRGKSSDARRCQKPPASASVNAAASSATRPANRSVSSGGQACSRSRCISGGDGVSPIYPNESSPLPYRMIRTSTSTNTRTKARLLPPDLNRNTAPRPQRT